MRYLDLHGSEVYGMGSYLKEYAEWPPGGNFGAWIRAKHYTAFDHSYKHWWLHRPKLFGKIYEETPPVPTE